MTQPDPSLSPPRSETPVSKRLGLLADVLVRLSHRAVTRKQLDATIQLLREGESRVLDLEQDLRIERLVVASPSGERGEPLLRKHIAALSKTLRSDASDHRYTSRAIANRLDAILSDSALPLSVEPTPEGWQPISTAPKDRGVLLYGAYTSGGLGIVQGAWNHGGAMHMPHWMGGIIRPTHWMPLPPPPPSEEPTPCREK